MGDEIDYEISKFKEEKCPRCGFITTCYEGACSCSNCGFRWDSE